MDGEGDLQGEKGGPLLRGGLLKRTAVGVPALVASQDGVGRGAGAGLLQGRGGQSGGRTRASAAPSSESLFIHLMQTHVDPACSMITMFYEKNSGPG